MNFKTLYPAEKSHTLQISKILSQILADTYITYLKTQNFHWNLVDPRFHSLHKMFEEFYKELAEITDEIAERMRMLKLIAPATMSEFLNLTTLDEGQYNIEGNQMITSLYLDREALSKTLKSHIEEVISYGDQGSGDMLIQHLRIHEKAAWMLQSHFRE